MLLGLWVLFEVELLQEKQETGPSSLFPTRGAVAVDQHYWLTDWAPSSSSPQRVILCWASLDHFCFKISSFSLCFTVTSSTASFRHTVQQYGTKHSFSLYSLLFLSFLSLHICTFAKPLPFPLVFLSNKMGDPLLCVICWACAFKLSLSLSRGGRGMYFGQPPPPPLLQNKYMQAFFFLYLACKAFQLPAPSTDVLFCICPPSICSTCWLPRFRHTHSPTMSCILHGGEEEEISSSNIHLAWVRDEEENIFAGC